MRDNQTIGNEASDIMATFIKGVEKFTPIQINKVPFEGSWTAGELAAHMVLANAGFVQMCNGPVKDTARKADEVEEKIKDVFLNFEIKMETPDFIKPAEKDYQKEVLMNDLKQVKKDIDRITTHMDLTQTCTSFEIPVFGYLTRYEAISFIIYHTQRHTRQLADIYSKTCLTAC